MSAHQVPDMQTPAPHLKHAEMQSGTSTQHAAERQARLLRAEKRRRSLHLVQPAGRPFPHGGSSGSRWSGSARKRWFDAAASSVILVLLAPVFLLITLMVRLSSRGPAIFRQQRVGRHGEEFTILKFRTMHCADRSGPSGSPAAGHLRSAHKDHRLIPPGRWLRKYKLDELPQLINVVRGEMSLVGPRPKLHAHHTVDTPFRPGITGAATLAFAAEEHLLRNVHHDDLESTHARLISPRKIQLDMAYMARATFATDLHLIVRTLLRAGRYTELDELIGVDPHPHTEPAKAPTKIPGAPAHAYPELLHPPTAARGLESVSL